jgi:hypothetical protein
MGTKMIGYVADVFFEFSTTFAETEKFIYVPVGV